VWYGCAFAAHFSYAADFSDAPPPNEIDKTKDPPHPEQNCPNRVFFGDTHLSGTRRNRIFEEGICHVTSIPL
jgi:hypothetical protein